MRDRNIRTSLLVIGLVVNIPIFADGCTLEQAQIHLVPPQTIWVLATRSCGGILCFEQWVESDGKRIRFSRACQVEKEASTLLPASPANP